VFYGWVIVAALSITETISWGILYYGFPVMLRPMEADLGFSRVEITGALSLGLATSARWPRCRSGAGSTGTAPAAS